MGELTPDEALALASNPLFFMVNDDKRRQMQKEAADVIKDLDALGFELVRKDDGK